MAEIKINLLKNRPVISEREYRRERLWLTRAIGVVVVSVIVLGAMTLWRLIITNNLRRVEQQIVQAKNQTAEWITASATQVYLKSRLKLVTNYLNERSLMRNALQRVLTNEVVGTSVTGVTFAADNIMRVQIEASSSATLAQVIDYYSQDGGLFVQAISRGVKRQENGLYQLDVELALPKGSK